MKTSAANFSQIKNPKAAIKSGTDPPAPYTTLLHGRSSPIEYVSEGLFNKQVIKVLPPCVQVIIELQLLYGLRITEALGIGALDIARNGLIFVKGKKNSQDRYIYSQRFSNYVMFCKVNNVSRLCDYSRFYFYRLYKKLGLYFKFPGYENNSVTHFFRHALLLQQKADGISTENSKKFIGHKSINSTKIYRDE